VKTRYTIAQTNATPFGGLYVVAEFLHRIRFHETFQNIFGHYRRVRKYTPSQTLAIAMASIIAGGERLYDIERFDRDEVTMELFELDDVPQDTTLRDDLAYLGQQDCQRREFLFQLHDRLFSKCGITAITLDIDGTALPVDGHQEGAVKGYCPTAPGSRCFQSLSAICDQTDTTMAEQSRPGNTTWSAEDLIGVCRPLLDRFSPKMHSITIRLDAGFYADEVLHFLESYDNVIYEVVKPQHAWLSQKVTALDYKSYHGSERHYATFAYGEGRNGAWRYYYVERTKKEPGSQLDLFDAQDYIPTGSL
jgi:hypothetical protein